MSNKKKKKKSNGLTVPKNVKKFKQNLLMCVNASYPLLERFVIDGLEEYEDNAKKVLNNLRCVMDSDNREEFEDIFSIDYKERYDLNFYLSALYTINEALKAVTFESVRNCAFFYTSIVEGVKENIDVDITSKDLELFLKDIIKDVYKIYDKKLINIAVNLYRQVNDDLLEDLFYNISNIIEMNFDLVNFKLQEDVFDYNEIGNFIERLFVYDLEFRDRILVKLAEENIGNKDLKEEIEIVSKENENNKIYKYIDNWADLNSIAENKGYILTRCKGDHGIFVHNITNKIVVIPQGRSIGKGLSIKIQKRIDSYAV